MFIKSSTALRNDYGSISDLAHNEAEPIYITKNGEGDLVVMSIEAFEQREETLKLRAKLEALLQHPYLLHTLRQDDVLKVLLFHPRRKFLKVFHPYRNNHTYISPSLHVLLL